MANVEDELNAHWHRVRTVSIVAGVFTSLGLLTLLWVTLVVRERAK